MSAIPGLPDDGADAQRRGRRLQRLSWDDIPCIPRTTPAAAAAAAVSASVLGLLLVALLTVARHPLSVFNRFGSFGGNGGGGGAWDGERDILVLYIFSNSDSEYLGNLQHFVEEAVNKDSRSEFVIIVQRDDAEAVDLPALPPHARYLHHDGDCFDWGTYGWYLAQHGVDRAKYRFFFLINCSVRGPFIPPMLQGEVEWWSPFVSKIGRITKLVGSTISCEGSPLGGDMKGVWRRNPHVQSFALATDQVGLNVLLADGQVFQCHESLWNTVYHSELGSSAAILKAGYNLDSLMLRYQGIDWRDDKNWGCNQKFSPNGEHYYDGITLDPYETMFVKVRSFLVSQQITSAIKAKKYSYWAHEGNSSDKIISVNDYLLSASKHRVPKILEKIAHGKPCFDVPFYLKKNPDLLIFETELDLWKHFVYFGQFEPRQHRFTCAMDYSRFASFGHHAAAAQQLTEGVAVSSDSGAQRERS